MFVIKKKDCFIRKPEFINFDILNDNCFEICLEKRKKIQKRPLTLGLFILSNAKLKMLEFVYNFLKQELYDHCYEIIYCDTDSIFLSLPKNETLQSCMKITDLNYQKNILKRYFDEKEIGKFKIEKIMKYFIGLNSKCYTTDSGNKCKGIKNINQKLNSNDYFQIINKELTHFELFQLGFKYNKQVTSMKTYSMKKRALNYVYLKRKLLSCGIHTKTLNI